MRTVKKYNLHIAEYGDNDFEIPSIEKSLKVPKELLGFNYAKSRKDYHKGVHFYLDDYQFERVWANPEKYIKLLKKFDCVFSPDFSLYVDMPLALQIYNIYRSRCLGAYWQSEGINVIPTLSWSDERSFSFCFEGIPEGSIVTVSTVGCVRNAKAQQLWRAGMDELIRRIQPEKILLYGKPIDYDFKNIEVIYFDNENIKRFEVLKNGRTWIKQ
ncbi:MAG: DUF4417 domain-containing protein [Streptococcaceae bacterium]|nr:DUF4417 domain-containing protein [Streptococcaceae bacterium]MCL2680888.1 DUF4417 domain-containing protein [Streptococcaceae bacterium]MCL2858084.1 DUF4417 domain-containing protein [Streptococcaceae bacterium]